MVDITNLTAEVQNSLVEINSDVIFLKHAAELGYPCDSFVIKTSSGMVKKIGQL